MIVLFCLEVVRDNKKITRLRRILWKSKVKTILGYFMVNLEISHLWNSLSQEESLHTKQIYACLHAPKDWWDTSKETTCQCKKSRSILFIIDNRKWRTFHLRDVNGKLWVEMFIDTFLNAEATVGVLVIETHQLLITSLHSQ